MTAHSFTVGGEEYFHPRSLLRILMSSWDDLVLGWSEAPS